MKIRNRLAAVLAAAALGIGASVGIGACGFSESTYTDQDGDVTTEEESSLKIP